MIEWHTSEACGGGSPSEGTTVNVGLAVFLSILSVIVVYLLAVFLYNRFALGAKGVDQIPHYHLCAAAYYSCLSCLVRDARRGGAPVGGVPRAACRVGWEALPSPEWTPIPHAAVRCGGEGAAGGAVRACP